MSIISSEADRLYPSSAWPDHPNVLRQLYDSDDLREAYEQGDTRQPTDEEIEAGAKALYDALNSVCFFSWESADLVVAFTDGGFLRREEYDGSEWWEYEPPFRVPTPQKPFKLVKLTSYSTQLLVDINYPMEATEE